jgi:carbonic anhydrase
MSRNFRAWALGLALSFASLSTAAQVVEWNHDPESAHGPNSWGTVSFPFATCGSQFEPVPPATTPVFVEVGKKQTPIDIVTALAFPTALPALITQYVATPLIVENTGHVVEVPVGAGSSIRIGQDSYELLQFHLHAPSEHAVDGQLAAGELHLVHRNALLDLAVVGVLLQVGTPVNPVIDRILLEAPLEEGEIDLEVLLNPKDVLPQQLNYYTYSGSLTTPPCSEGVRWFVLKDPVFVSQAAIDNFHAIISAFPGYEGFDKNNRPVRPLNGRAVLQRIGN